MKYAANLREWVSLAFLPGAEWRAYFVNRLPKRQSYEQKSTKESGSTTSKRLQLCERREANPGKLPFMKPSLITPIVHALQSVASLELAMIFGSVARDEANMSSDLDVAVRYAKPLDAQQKLTLIEALADVSGRAIDLIDLRVAGPIIAREALTGGRRIFGTNEIWASQTARTLIDYADFVPLIERTLRERREAWMRT